jgi:tetratricopeptide (TPR) repeat protein
MWKERSGAEGAVSWMSGRRLLVLSLGAAVIYLLFNSSYRAWSGGATFGPRHLVPVIPFLLIPIARLLRAHPREYRWPAILLVTYSILFSLVAVAGGPEAHEYLRNPVRESALTYVLSGDVRWNLGRLAGLGGLSSLIPLAALWAFCLVILFGRGTAGEETEPRPLGRGGRLMRAGVCIAGAVMMLLFAFHRTPETAYRYAVIGHGYDMRGDEHRAAEMFEMSLSLDPRQPLVLRDYARLAERRGDYALALDLEMRLLSLRPGDREVLRRVERLFTLKGGSGVGEPGPQSP